MLGSVVRLVDALNDWVGRTVAWLTLGCVLTCFTVVVLRYGFDIGFPWMQELYVWQHAAVFMAGAGYTFLHRGHVNVDLLFMGSEETTQMMSELQTFYEQYKDAAAAPE